MSVSEDEQGRVCLHDLRRKLTELSSESAPGRVIGMFCAASNVTGALNDDLAVTALLRAHGALAFWDYAAAAPYTKVDMNPCVPGDHDKLCEKDAIFFSGHKFVGGVQVR